MTTPESGPRTQASGDETVEGTLAPRVYRAAPVAPGDRIGRYVVLRQVGKGAMGEVLAAYDPELDRQIALKLLARDSGGGRLGAEARAMARLSHPNVVGIHDVSEVDGRPLIAMELVDGTTLAKWLETKPAVPEVIEAFVAAGRGLAAAHDAGIVHRDFKPANVFVDVDADTGKVVRVRVGDFGLAEATQAAPTEPKPQPGALVGTPRYMSPEHFGDGSVTARADQFSFCVALYEGLYGETPFAGETPAELARAVLEGDRCPVPERTEIPRRVRAVLERGLSIDSGRRFESMDALLAELTPPSRRRNWVLTAALVGLAGVGGLVVAPDPVPSGCEAEAVATISPERRSRAEAALQSHGLAAGTWAELDTTISELERTSAETRREACEAYEAGAISEDVLYSQLQCVDVSDAELDALLGLWRDADEQTAAVAPHALYTITRGSCTVARTQGARDRSMEPELLQSLIAGRATALALQHSGKSREAVAHVDALSPESLAPSKLVADLFRLRGQARLELGDLDRAEADLWRSLGIATGIDAHEAAALAWIWLINIESDLRGRPQAALRWQEVAEAHVGSAPWLGTLLHNHLGAAHFANSDYDAAERAFELSLELCKEVRYPIVGHDALLHNNLGSVHGSRGELEEAEQHWRTSLRLYRDDPSTTKASLARPLMNLARLHTLFHDEERAAPERRECLELAHAIQASSPAVASETAASLAELFEYAGQYRDAHDAASAALMFVENEPDADAVLVATRRLQLSRYVRTLDLGPQTNLHLQQGMKAVDGGVDVVDVEVARALVAELEWQIEHGDPARAEALAERATSVIEGGSGAIQLPVARLYRARARLLASRSGAQAALEYLRGPRIDPTMASYASLHAARAELWLEHGDREQAERAARAGVDTLSNGRYSRERRCLVRTALVRVTMPDPDPRDVAQAVEACDTDPPRPEAAFLASLPSTEP